MRTWGIFSSLTKVTTVQSDDVDRSTDSLETEAVELFHSYLEKKARSMQVPRKGATDLVKLCFCILSYVQKLANVLWTMSPIGIRKDQIETIFSICFPVAVMKAMDAKVCLCLMLIILGTLTAQGAILRNEKRNPSPEPLGECFFDQFMLTFL